MKTCILGVSRFHILIILLLFIILILLLFLEYFASCITKKTVEFFQTNTPNPVLNVEYNQLVENRNAYLKELDQQFAKFQAENPGDVKNFISPQQIVESKVSLSNVSYKDTIKNFFVQEKAERVKKEAELADLDVPNGNIYNIKQYKQLMLKNNKKQLFKKALNKIEILKDECFEKCDQSNCIKLDQKKKLLEKCMKCNSTKNKCFHKTIIGGECDDCDGVDEKDKLDCLALTNFGYPNPNHLDDLRGVDPYYFLLNDNSPTSPFNKKCVFCWQMEDQF
jgi:hypothetical protein